MYHNIYTHFLHNKNHWISFWKIVLYFHLLACKYCYARFMKRFTGHKEEWGKFIDIKQCEKPINLKRLKGKSVFMSSVTDCYNSYDFRTINDVFPFCDIRKNRRHKQNRMDTHIM